jgi:hypothetical protein
MFSVLSFSHWGVGQKNGNEPISGLLLYPKSIAFRYGNRLKQTNALSV